MIANECGGCARLWASLIGNVGTCAECGATLARTESVVASSKPRRPRRPRGERPMPAAEDRVATFVRDVLRWGSEVARVERAARGSSSPLAGMLARAELYGHDSSGRRIEGALVHGTMGGSTHDDADPIHVDPISQGRYDSLRSADRMTVDAIVEDGAGEMLVERFFGVRAYVLALSQRVAFKIVPQDKLAAWARKLGEGDPTPALEASRRVGDDAIRAASAAWWTKRATRS